MKRKLLLVSLIIATSGIVIFARKILFYWPVLRPPYRIFESPYGSFKVVVYRVPIQNKNEMVAPGQAGDAPGYVALWNTDTGRLLRCQRIRMVSMVDPEWSSNEVRILSIPTWKLP